MPKKATDALMIAIGVGLMAFVLLTARSSSVARWSLVAVAVSALALGARGMRRESRPRSLWLSGCAAVVVAVAANLGLFGTDAIVANVLAALIMVVMAVIVLVPTGKDAKPKA
jgi:peptidoglycan/LPS O-acetylase OafA/YrhL